MEAHCRQGIRRHPQLQQETKRVQEPNAFAEAHQRLQ